MKSKITTISFWIVVAVVLVYLAASVIPSIFRSEKLSVRPAESILYDDALEVTGIALRDEVLVSAQGTPASIDFKVSDGDRISIGDTVATYGTTQSTSTNRLTLDNIDRQIGLLNDCISATTQYNLQTLDAKTKDAIELYLSASNSGNLTETTDASIQVISYFIKRDIKATGDKSYYKQILSNCESTRKTLLTGNVAKQTAVYAPQAGYFSSQYDGYESLKSSDYIDCDPKTVHSLLEMNPEKRPSDYIGKLQHFSYWTYVCTVSEEKASIFEKGTSWAVRFDTSAHGSQTVNMTVINRSESSDGEIAITLEGPSFNEALYSLRICNARIVLQSYSGFRVDKDAIRVLEGETGVYVLSGAKLVFKPVSVLFRNEEKDFAVITPNTDSPSRTLILNDSVVIGGKDVYDGKVVNIN